MTPEDIERRRSAKRINEQIKIVANALNTISVAAFGAGFVLPAIAHQPIAAAPWLILAVAIHSLAHVVLRLLQSED